MLLALVLVVLALPAARSVLQAEITNHWPGGFHAELVINARENHEGFQVYVIFDVPVDSLEVWDETAQKLSDYEFLLTSRDYFSHVTSGQRLTINFNGRTSQDLAAHVCAYIKGEEPDSVCPRPGQTTAETTSTPSTSTPMASSELTPTGSLTTATPIPDTTPSAIASTTGPVTTATPIPDTTPEVSAIASTTGPVTTATPIPDTTPEVSAMASTTGPVTTATPIPDTTPNVSAIASTTGPVTTATPISDTTPQVSAIASTPGPATTAIPISETTSTPALTTTPTPVPTTATTMAPTTTTPLRTTIPPQDMKNFAEALRLSQLFYYAQRSGRLPADNPVSWRADSALGDCVSGGWYDAGDHVKFGFPMAGALTILLWGGDRFQQGYKDAHQLATFYDTVKWGLDYLLNAWDPFKQQLVVQVGDGDVDHQFWGRPEDMTMSRPCVVVSRDAPGSDVAAETAAALAAGAVVFKAKGDTRYAAELLTAAESIYNFARMHRGLFSNHSLPANISSWYYRSSGDDDELCQAAVWMFRATADPQYVEEAKQYYRDVLPTEYSWDDKTAACQLLLYEVTLDARYRRNFNDFLDSWQPGGKASYSPCGFAWKEQTYWGSARHVSNVAFLALLAADDELNAHRNRKWAAEQVNYLLGDNPHDGGCFSYEIGYGDKYPLRPHHRAASCPDPPAPCSEAANLHTDSPSPHVLYGGLVGGPELHDSYNDSREDYVHNEVALDYNAGFQSALAG